MQELKRSKLKKGTNLDRKHSRKSIKSDNLHVPLTPSTFRKIKTSSSRPSTAKSGSRVEQLKSVGEREPLVRLSHAQPSEVPNNVAVHFASFYQNRDQTLPHSAQEKLVGPKAAETSKNFPKMEFTRQMVYRLENSAGTQQYGRQVSAVLENTVEAPGFNLNLPPIDNCAPFDVPNDYYPLWYRDPNKMPQISQELFQEMKDKYRYKMAGKELNRGIRKVEEPISAESESETEFETETESEEDEAKCKVDSKSHLLKRRSKSSEIISKSNSTVQKDLENSLVNINQRSMNCSSSNSYSSQTSCEITTHDDEEESLGWETDAEEEQGEEEGQITVKVVHNYRKNAVVNQM